MTQETGETRNAILKDDEALIEKIVNANKGRSEPYWIVLFAKPSKNTVDGKPTLVKHIKPYGRKPRSQVGMIVGEVNNQKGTIEWEVNMPQKPFDFDALRLYGAKPCDEIVTETTTIANAYITR